MRSYPVLDPVSQAYPKVQGRSPTCYSPVRHSYTPEDALTVRLACVKHAASVRPEPGSNSPNKTPKGNQRKPDQNTPHPQHGKTPGVQQKNNKQKPPSTLMSSQTTPPDRPPEAPAARGPRTNRADGEGTRRNGVSLEEAVALGGLAASRRLQQVTRGKTGSQTTC